MQRVVTINYTDNISKDLTNKKKSRHLLILTRMKKTPKRKRSDFYLKKTIRSKSAEAGWAFFYRSVLLSTS